MTAWLFRYTAPLHHAPPRPPRDRRAPSIFLAVTTATALGGAVQAQTDHGGQSHTLRALGASDAAAARVFRPEASRSLTTARSTDLALESATSTTSTTITSPSTTAVQVTTPLTTIAKPVTAAPVLRTVHTVSSVAQTAPIVWTGGGMAPRNSIEACISARENGGSYSRSSNPGHFGRWQLSTGLWNHYAPRLESRFPGISSHWGYASPAEQDAVFVAVVASDPTYSNWRPYDGC